MNEKKIGRPWKSSARATAKVQISVTPDTKALWRKWAFEHGTTITDLIMLGIDKVINKKEEK
jgi:hypothetical protein